MIIVISFMHLLWNNLQKNRNPEKVHEYVCKYSNLLVKIYILIPLVDMKLIKLFVLMNLNFIY